MNGIADLTSKLQLHFLNGIVCMETVHLPESCSESSGSEEWERTCVEGHCGMSTVPHMPWRLIMGWDGQLNQTGGCIGTSLGNWEMGWTNGTKNCINGQWGMFPAVSFILGEWVENREFLITVTVAHYYLGNILQCWLNSTFTVMLLPHTCHCGWEID